MIDLPNFKKTFFLNSDNKKIKCLPLDNSKNF